MARKVSQSDIQTMNELYKQYGTYAAVARETGLTAATVKRYVVDDYGAQENSFVFEGGNFKSVEEVRSSLPEDLSSWLSLSKAEILELEELKKGMAI